MKIRKSLIICSLSLSALAWETDNFTSRRKIAKVSDSEIIDNLYSLNDKMNKDIRKVIDDFAEDYDCREDVAKIKKNQVPTIYSWIDDALGGTHAVIEEYAEDGNVKMYDHKRAWVTMSSNLYGKSYGLQGAFNLNGYVVGPDKVGHFVDQGYDLIKKFIRNGGGKQGFLSAMEKSNDMEEGGFGLFASGIKSYGDMGANMSGLSFYYNLLSGDNPQLTCNPKTKKYEINYDFNFADYVNDSWDEGINCSFFDSVDNPYKRNEVKSSRVYTVYPPADEDEIVFRKNLKNMKPPLTCPDSMDKCKDIVNKNCSNYFVSPMCIRAVDKKVSCDMSDFDKMFKVTQTGGYKYERGISKPRSRGAKGKRSFNR
jgi:hypothetical protein